MGLVSEFLESRFPGLFQVLGGYLHQDWDIEAETPDDALRLAAEEGPKQAAAAVREIDMLLASDVDDKQLMRLIERLTAGYSPELAGWEARAWLVHARELLSTGATA
jgi:CdiI immunity protein